MTMSQQIGRPMPGNSRLSVAVATTEPLAAIGLAAVIDSQPDMSCSVRVNGDETSLLDILAHAPPDVCLLDIPDHQAGTALVNVVQTQCPDVGLVVVATEAKMGALVLTLERGPAAILTRELLSAESVAAAVRAAVRGLAVLDTLALAALTQQLGPLPDSTILVGAMEGVAKLTPREYDILALLACGQGNAEIARRLSLSIPTVKGHVSSILSKLAVCNRSQAIVVAYSLGLIPFSARLPVA